MSGEVWGEEEEEERAITFLLKTYQYESLV